MLLTIFAAAAWIESTERWSHLPDPAVDAPQTVSNMDALEVRKLAKLVQDEREVSSRPLVQHLCAACGGLLGPAMLQRKTSAHEMGKPGAAYQVIGQSCQAEVMPPFLLLFSKRLLGCRLPAVFAYDSSSNALRLRPGIKAPWLHYTSSRGGTATVDLCHPWWYCKPCWRYWQTKPSGKHCKYAPKPGALPETIALQAGLHSATELQRIPMRNKMEGYFTAWHRDLAYSHLEPGLRRLYPDHPTLLASQDVLAWREARKVNVAKLQHLLSEHLRFSFVFGSLTAAQHIKKHVKQPQYTAKLPIKRPSDRYVTCLKIHWLIAPVVSARIKCWSGHVVLLG